MAFLLRLLILVQVALALMPVSGQRLLAITPLDGDFVLASLSPNGTLSPIGAPLGISPAWGVSTFDAVAGTFFTLNLDDGTVVGVSAATGTIVSRAPLPRVFATDGCCVFIAWAPDLHGLAVVGDAANGTHIVGLLDAATGAFSVRAAFATPGDRDNAVGNAAYVPRAQLFVFDVKVAGGALPEDSYVNFAVNVTSGAVFNRTDPNGEPGPSVLATRDFYAGDGLIYGTGTLQCIDDPPPCEQYAFNRTVTSLDPRTLALTVRGLVLAFGVSLGSISAVGDAGTPGGSIFWLGFATPFVPGRGVPIFLVQNALADARVLSQSAPLCVMGALPPPSLAAARGRRAQVHPDCPWSLEWDASASLTAAVAAPLPTYYVSSSGDDSASGTSPATPWRTLAHARTGAGAALRAGASLLLRRGDVFTLSSPWVLDGVGSAATSGGPRVLLGAWGAASERPVIVAAAPAQAGPLIWLADGVRTDIVGLELRGAEAGVALTYSASANADLVIRDCVVRDSRAANVSNEGGDWGGAFVLAATHALVTVSGISLRNNAAVGCDTLLHESPPASWGALTVLHLSELVVDGNFATATWGNTIGLNWVVSALVTRNTLLRNGPPPGISTPRGTTDIILGAVPPAVIVTENEVGWRGEGVGAPDGCALDFEVASQNITVASNYFHHAWGAAFLVFGHGTTSTGLVLANNTLVENGCNQSSFDRGELALTKPNSTGVFAGNTVVHSCGPFVTSHWPSSAEGWEISDNAVDGINATLAVLPAPLITRLPGGVGIVLDATCAACPRGALLRYSIDGSRPSASSAAWPPGGLHLPPRTVVVLVKAFPPMHSAEVDSSVPLFIEGPADGGLFAPATGSES